MKLLFFILLFALAFESCIALPSLRDCHAITIVAGTIVTSLSGMYLWPPFQHMSDVAPFDSQIPQNDTVLYEHQIDVRVFDSRSSPKNTVSVNLWQPWVLHTDENDITAAYMNSRPTARVVVITDATNAIAPLASLRTNGENTTITVATELPKDHTRSHNRSPNICSGNPMILPYISQPTFLFGLAPAIVFCTSFAIVALLTTYQVLVYDTNFHNSVRARYQYLLAKITWSAIILVDILPSPVKATSCTVVLVPAALFSRLCKYFGFRPVRTDAVKFETVLGIYRELKKLNNHRYRQTLGYKRLRTLRLMRRNKAKIIFRQAAQELEEQHGKCRTAFQNSIADLRRQLFQYSQLESRLNVKSKAVAKAGDLLNSHIVNLSDRMRKLDKAMALVTTALPKSKETFQDMYNLVRQIDKLLQESKSADSKVRHAEEIIKTLYNVDARMKMAPFTDQLEFIAKAAAEAQKVIYNAQTTIVLASVAHRTPSQLFESEIVAAKMTQSPATPALPMPPPPPPTLPKAVEGPPAPPLAPAASRPSAEPKTAQRPQAPCLVSAPAPPAAPPQAVQRLSTPPLDPASVSLPPSLQPPQNPPVPPLALVSPSSLPNPLAVQRLRPLVLATHPPPSPPSPPFTKEDVVLPSTLVEPDDESMAESAPVLAPPLPPTPMVDVVRFPNHAEPKDQNMAEAPSVPGPAPPDTSMEDALLPPPPSPVPSEAKEEEMTEAPPAPPPPPAPPQLASARTPIPATLLVAFHPRSVRLNQAGTRPALRMTRPMPSTRPVPRITKFKPPTSLPPRPAPPARAPALLPPPTPAPTPKAIPPQSERINQAAVDQVMLTGARDIIRPTPRLKKPNQPTSVPAPPPPPPPTPPALAPPVPAPAPPPPPLPQQYTDIVNDLPPSAPFDAVGRLINLDGDNVDDCLLASRDDDDDDDDSISSSADYVSDSTLEERERDRRQEAYERAPRQDEKDEEGEGDGNKVGEVDPNNGYGSYGNLSDIDLE